MILDSFFFLKKLNFKICKQNKNSILTQKFNTQIIKSLKDGLNFLNLREWMIYRVYMT
jgi:hypothetical protein